MMKDLTFIGNASLFLAGVTCGLYLHRVIVRWACNIALKKNLKVVSDEELGRFFYKEPLSSFFGMIDYSGGDNNILMKVEKNEEKAKGDESAVILKYDMHSLVGRVFYGDAKRDRYFWGVKMNGEYRLIEANSKWNKVLDEKWKDEMEKASQAATKDVVKRVALGSV